MFYLVISREEGLIIFLALMCGEPNFILFDEHIEVFYQFILVLSQRHCHVLESHRSPLNHCQHRILEIE